MRENNFGRQSDRSYLCLIAIYAIHAILLNVVFLQPNLDNIQTSMTLPSSYVIDSGTRGLTMSIMKNLSETVIMKIDSENYQNDIVISSKRTNSTGYVEIRKNIVQVSDDNNYSMKMSTDPFLQSKSSGAEVRFLSTAKTLSVLRLTNKAMSIARSIIERLSPAALGIISGCLVFLLTFTENDYV